MMRNKIIVLAVVVGLAVAGAVVWKTGIASAYFSGKSKDTTAEKLAEKLNVSKDQVTTAMDQIQSENQAERLAKISENLDKAVSDGVITSDQKQAILDKMNEMQQKREQERKDMEQWQTDNNIDWSKLRDYDIGMGMGKGGRGHGGPMM